MSKPHHNIAACVLIHCPVCDSFFTALFKAVETNNKEDEEVGK